MTSPSPNPPTLGLVAEKYTLERLLGRGGMGSVWEARHVELGTRVAIKFIESQYATSAEALGRFRNEALAAAKIDSKHAIKIFDFGVQDGMPFIVMEVLVGEPLDKRLERLGRLGVAETVRVLQQVCRALTRAHDQGIVHRDLKPENIFIVADEDSEIAKVLDFGIAKMMDPKDQLSASTKTGAVLGTPYYMSPEQARGLRDIDQRSDLWALGVIAYRCITGQLPFDGASLGDLLVKICTAPPPVASRIAAGVPAGFDAWIARALDRDPAMRFASARELSESLAMACGVSLQGGPPTPAAFGYPATSPAISTGSPQATPAPSWQGQPGSAAASYGPTQVPNGATPAAYGGTNASFTASNGPAKNSPKGLIFAALGAAVLGAGLVAFAVFKIAGSHADVTSRGASSAAALPSQASVEVAQPPPTAVAELPPASALVPATPAASARPVWPPRATAAASARPPAIASASAAPKSSAAPVATYPARPPTPPRPADLGPGF